MAIFKNTAKIILFRMEDVSGASVAGTPTCKVSKDGAAFAACSNAPVTIAGSVGGGYWYITLTAAEMNADGIIFEATLTGAVTVSMVVYTEADYTAARATLLDSIEDIDAKTSLLGVGTVTVVSPLSSDSTTVNLLQGYDYNAATNNQTELASTQWPDLTGATVSLVDEDEAVFPGTVTVSDEGEATQTLTVEWTKEETDEIGVSTTVVRIKAVLAGGEETVLTTLTVEVE